MEAAEAGAAGGGGAPPHLGGGVVSPPPLPGGGVVSPPPLPQPVGPPVVGESVNVRTLSGVIGIKCEGDSEFRPLEGEEQIPVGCLIDARNGHVLLTSSRGTGGGTQTGEFWGGNLPRQAEGRRQALHRVGAGRPECQSEGHRGPEG